MPTTVKAPDFDVTWTPPQPGPTMAARGTTKLSVTVTNSGSDSWPAGGDHPVRVSYQWTQPYGIAVGFDCKRVAFRTDVAPNQKVSLDATIKAPDKPGSY